MSELTFLEATMFFFLKYQVQECPLFYCFFYYNIFIYFIQIKLNVLYDLGVVGGGGGGSWGKGNPLIWNQQDMTPCP